MLVTPVCLSLMRLQSSAKRNILLLFYSSLVNFNIVLGDFWDREERVDSIFFE